MDTALTQKFPFILDRNLAKANCTGNRVCTSCDTVVLALPLVCAKKNLCKSRLLETFSHARDAILVRRPSISNTVGRCKKNTAINTQALPIHHTNGKYGSTAFRILFSCRSPGFQGRERRVLIDRNTGKNLVKYVHNIYICVL